MCGKTRSTRDVGQPYEKIPLGSSVTDIYQSWPNQVQKNSRFFLCLSYQADQIIWYIYCRLGWVQVGE